MVDASVTNGLSSEEKALALRAVLESDTFSRSGRLKSLLRFICEAEMESRGAELTEYRIGTEALGRPKDFAPLEDSSVRSRVHELRQKLDKYYSQEAPFAPVRIDLRKGSYVPRFSAVLEQEANLSPVTNTADSAPDLVPAVASAAKPSPGPPNFSSLMLAGAFAIGCAAMFGIVALWSVLASPGSRFPGTRFETVVLPSLWTPELEAIWRPFIQKDTPLLITFETRFFVNIGPLVVRDWHIDSIAGVEKSEPLMQVQKLFGTHQLYPSSNYTDVGAPGALFYLTRALATRVQSLSVRSSGELSAADLRDSNIIILGKPGRDAQIQRVLANADLMDMNGRVLLKNPASGERSEYVDQRENKLENDIWSEKYSVISVMPGRGGQKRILALTASGSENPSALAYYLTQPETVRDLVRHLRSNRSRIPDFFQILVRFEFKGKALVKAEYVTHRILKT